MPFYREWNQEFEVMHDIQADRMHFAAAMQCREKCLSSSWTAAGEDTCFINCLKKLAQAAVVTDINYNKYNDLEAKARRK